MATELATTQAMIITFLSFFSSETKQASELMNLHKLHLDIAQNFMKIKLVLKRDSKYYEKEQNYSSQLKTNKKNKKQIRGKEKVK